MSVVSFKPLQQGWEKRPKGAKNSSDNPQYGEIWAVSLSP